MSLKEREEKEKPESLGINIEYDCKDQVLVRDGRVIDRFSPSLFLKDHPPCNLNLCSWNMARLRDKLQEQDILGFILQFNIVWLLETKKYFNLNVPGFNIYRNVSRGQHRGGVMFVKSKLSENLVKWIRVRRDRFGQ